MTETSPPGWLRFARNCLLLGVGGSAVLISAVVVVAGVQEQRANARAERMRVGLQESLPPGSSREAAEAWFAAHGITPGPVFHGPDRRVIGFCKYIRDDTLLETADLCIEVHLDDHHRVTTATLRRIVLRL